MPAMRKIRHLWIGFTPFIWHWPHIDRSLSADYIYRCGPFSVSGLGGD